MKISLRAILAVALATGFVTAHAFAQEAVPTNAPAVALTNKPAAVKKASAPKMVAPKGAPKAVAKRVEAAPEPVLNPEPAVAKQANVNIRGQAKINSEIVGRIKKGEAVTILEEITLKKPKQDEPSHWFRVILPPAAGAWVHASFIDGTTVKANKLNLRGGPGEEYSILGRVEKGTPIKQIETKGDWIKIEAPTNATGFVAAHLLDRTPMAIAAAAPKSNEVAVVPAVPPTTVPVTTDPAPVVAETPTTPTVATAPTNSPVPPVPVVPVAEEPLEKVKKVVSREGFLKGSVSIQAPTYFELRSLDTGKTIDYLFSPSTNLMLREFKGQRIIVTGEELLDERWQNTPVLIVDSIQTVP